ncbi:MAG: glycosyltransferase family 4 protein [Desulfosoma sp.]|uniref:glycosyltransferase family 4 protein n=1 Tax=Desulfosoma sp. TaxID=2603217 RepID=UPI00404B57FB
MDRSGAQAPRWANVVHVNSWFPLQFLPQSLPMIVTIHHNVHDSSLKSHLSLSQRIYHRYWIKRVEARLLDRAIRIVAVSRFTAASVARTFGVQRMHVIYNGIRLDGPYQPEGHRCPRDPFRLIYVGNCSKRKGVDLLGPIMRELGKNFELRYTVGLRRKTIPQLPNNCVPLKKSSSTEDVARALRQSDAMLFPSRMEGFGLAPLEAMACGLPVVAARSSALPQVIEHGVTGVLCPQDDTYAFVEAVRQLAENPNLWCLMGREARLRAERLFDLKQMIDLYVELYRASISNDFSACPSLGSGR